MNSSALKGSRCFPISTFGTALNYCYLPVSEQDGDRFDEELKRRGISFRASRPFSNLDIHQIIERSWEKIFDLDWSEDGYSNPKSQKSIQATFWELRVDQVRHEQHFTAR